MTEPLTVPDVDLDMLGRLLLKLEANVHRAGWNRNPHVRILYDVTADGGATDRLYRRLLAVNPRKGAPTTQGRYAAITWLDEDSLVVNRQPPWESLRTLVMNLAYAPDAEPSQAMTDLLRQPGVFGFAAVTEAYKFHTTDRAEYTRILREEVHAADLPTTRDCRAVWAVDLASRVHVVERIRGEKPVLELDVGQAGDWSTSMRILADVMTGTVAPAEQFAQRYPTLVDLNSRSRPEGGAG